MFYGLSYNKTTKKSWIIGMKQIHIDYSFEQVSCVHRKYSRQLKALRMAARSSLYKKDISAHVHQYQDEVYHEDKVSSFILFFKF